MSSFQVLVLGSTDGFLSPFPDSLPQLFLRCLPCAFAFGLSPSNPLPFVHFSSGSGYSASVSSFPLSSRFPPHSGSSSVLPLRSRFLAFPRSFRPDLSCLLPRFFVLGFLFVSFRPSLIRSHSCSSGAYLVLSLSVFSLPIRFLSSTSFPVLATQPLFLPFLFFPAPPHSSFLGCCLSAFRLLDFSTSVPPSFPCFPSVLSTQLSAFLFSVHCLASQWLLQCLSLLPFGSWPLPLGFRFRFWLLSLRNVSLIDTS